MSSLSFRALGFVGLSFIVSACGGALSAAQGPGEVDKTPPSLSIQSLNGKGAVSLSALAGKVVVVEFWATWCEPCKNTLVQLEELRAKSGGAIEVVGISVDDTSSGVEAFAKAQGLSFPIAWDEHRSLMWRWSVEAMPTTFILDAKGRIRFVHEPDKKNDQRDVIARELALLSDEVSPSQANAAVATATPDAAAQRVALAVAVTDPAPVTPAAEEATAAPPSEAPQPGKPRAKPNAGKKGVAKKTKKTKPPEGGAAKS